MPGQYKPGSGVQIVELQSGDIQIGAVELKNGATDDRALISAANTARAAGNMTLLVQAVDAAGGVLGTSGLATSALQLPDGHAVTVDNASGAAAVNIQDGGNTITVDGTVTVNTISGFATADKQPTLGSGAMAGSAPVTLATDDTQMGAVGADSDVDGNIHGQLRYIGEAVDGLESDIAVIKAALDPQASAQTWAEMTETGYTSWFDAGRLNSTHVCTFALALNGSTDVTVELYGSIDGGTTQTMLDSANNIIAAEPLTSVVPFRYIRFRFRAEAGGTDATITPSYMGQR